MLRVTVQSHVIKISDGVVISKDLQKFVLVFLLFFLRLKNDLHCDWKMFVAELCPWVAPTRVCACVCFVCRASSWEFATITSPATVLVSVCRVLR